MSAIGLPVSEWCTAHHFTENSTKIIRVIVSYQTCNFRHGIGCAFEIKAGSIHSLADYIILWGYSQFLTEDCLVIGTAVSLHGCQLGYGQGFIVVLVDIPERKQGSIIRLF